MQIDYDNPTLTAIDRSAGANYREWWVNGDDYGGFTDVSYTPDLRDDSVYLMLVAHSRYCTDTSVMVVPICSSTIFAPNAFTPDESSNQEFVIKMDGIVDYELSIYNRQGLLVFHTTDRQESWNGTYKGKPCPQGNYVWVMKYTTERSPRTPEVRKGSVLLLR